MLQELGDEAKILAGGHSLVPTMKLRLATPTHLIDIGHLDKLKGIELSESGNQISIGSLCTHHEVMNNGHVREHLKGFVECASAIGDIQVRNRGTIGGSIAHADPAADWPAMILAYDAIMVAQGPNGRREIAAKDFFTGFYSSALEEDEILTRIRVKIPPQGTRATYQKFFQPASRFAIVGCAVVMQSNGVCSDVRVAFSGVSATPFRDQGVEAAIEGKPGDATTIAEASSQAAHGRSVLGDHWASKEYRTHLAKVYAKRALTTATQ